MKRILVLLLIIAFGASLPASGMGDAPREKKAAVSKPAAGPLIDINSASAEELMVLDGIGEARAKAIIKGRPYGRKDELAKRNIIPDAVYEKIKDRLIAKQK